MFSITETLFSLRDVAFSGRFNKVEYEFEEVALRGLKKLQQAFKLLTSVLCSSESSCFFNAPTPLEFKVYFLFCKVYTYNQF